MNLKGSVSVSDMRIALRFTPIKSLDEVNTKRLLCYLPPTRAILVDSSRKLSVNELNHTPFV